jgi:hypothetical protein
MQQFPRHEFIYARTDQEEILKDGRAGPAEERGVKESTAAQETKRQFAVVARQNHVVKTPHPHPRPQTQKRIQDISGQTSHGPNLPSLLS